MDERPPPNGTTPGEAIDDRQSTDFVGKVADAGMQSMKAIAFLDDGTKM
jgi:hypothetical protein